MSRLTSRGRGAAVLVAALLALAGCGGSTHGAGGTPGATKAFPEGSTMYKIREKGELTVGVKFDTPLFGYKDPSTGRLTGFDVEIAHLIAADLTGSPDRVRFVETVANQREKAIETGKVDMVVATYTMNTERDKVIDFAGPYYMAGQDTLVRAADTGIRTPEDLAGRTVCAASGSTSAARISSRIPRARLYLVTRDSECVPALLSHKIDAVSTDDTILLSDMVTKPDAFRMLGKPFSSEPYGIGIRNDDTVFRTYLNGLLRGYVHDGRWNEVYKRTVGTVSSGTVPIKPVIP